MSEEEKAYYHRGGQNLMSKMNAISLKRYVDWLAARGITLKTLKKGEALGNSKDSDLRRQVIYTLFSLPAAKLKATQIAWAKNVVEHFQQEIEANEAVSKSRVRYI